MNTIDLTKAKIGDKFKTDSGYVVQFVSLCRGSKYKYYVESADGRCWLRCDSKGNSKVGGKQYRLIEKVIDKADGKEAKTETKRRQDVLKYADMLFFDQKDTRVALFRYDEAIKAAENIVNIRDEYLKEGKLC